MPSLLLLFGTIFPIKKTGYWVNSKFVYGLKKGVRCVNSKHVGRVLFSQPQFEGLSWRVARGPLARVPLHGSAKITLSRFRTRHGRGRVASSFSNLKKKNPTVVNHKYLPVNKRYARACVCMCVCVTV